MQEYSEEMQYICKQDKTIQEERIWESKYKIAITELGELKDKFKQMEKQKKDVENQTLIAKKKQRKEATEKAKKNKTKESLSGKGNIAKEVIKALGRMATTKIESFPNKKLLIKELQTSFKKDKNLVEENTRGKLFKTNRN